MSTKKKSTQAASAKKKKASSSPEADEGFHSTRGRMLKVVRVRMTLDERDKLFQLAEEDGLKASQWVRYRITESWKKREKKISAGEAA